MTFWKTIDAFWGSTKGNKVVQCGVKGDIPAPADYFNEGKLRIAVYRPSNGLLYIKGNDLNSWGRSSGNVIFSKARGLPSLLAPASVWCVCIVPTVRNKLFEVQSPAVFKSEGGIWTIGDKKVQCGKAGDVPVPLDYFNEGKKRLAVWRPSDGVWYIKGRGYQDWENSEENLSIQCGIKGDIPVAGHYNEGGKISLAV